MLLLLQSRYCELNPDESYKSCDAPQELTDHEIDQALTPQVSDEQELNLLPKSQRSVRGKSLSFLCCGGLMEAHGLPHTG